MWQGQHVRPEFPPTPDPLGDRQLPAGQVPGVGVLANNQRQLYVLQTRKQQIAPGRRAFWSRRQVPGFSGTGVTEPHRQYGQLFLIIKRGPVYSHPVPQAITAGVIEWQTGLMHPPPRGLPHHQNTGTPGKLDNRTGAQREVVLADSALAHLGYQVIKGQPGIVTGHFCHHLQKNRPLHQPPIAVTIKPLAAAGKRAMTTTALRMIFCMTAPPTNLQRDVTSSPALDEFRKVVRSRRSVRRFTDEAVPVEVLEDCLELAMLAPNSSNLQPWEFFVVQTPELKARLARACLGQNAAKTAPVLIAVVARPDTWREHARMALEQWPEEKLPGIVETYYSKIAPIHYNQGPLGLFGLAKKTAGLALGLTRPVPRGPYSPNEMKIWATKSTALAAENLMLALVAHGFDSCPMEGFDECRVRRLLKLPKRGLVTMILAAGKRSEKGVYNRQYRFDKDELVHYL